MAVDDTGTVLIVGMFPAVLHIADVAPWVVVIVGSIAGLFNLAKLIKLIKDWNK